MGYNLGWSGGLKRDHILQIACNPVVTRGPNGLPLMTQSTSRPMFGGSQSGRAYGAVPTLLPERLTPDRWIALRMWFSSSTPRSRVLNDLKLLLALMSLPRSFILPCGDGAFAPDLRCDKSERDRVSGTSPISPEVEMINSDWCSHRAAGPFVLGVILAMLCWSCKG